MRWRRRRCKNRCKCGDRCTRDRHHVGDCAYGKKHQAVVRFNREWIEANQLRR